MLEDLSMDLEMLMAMLEEARDALAEILDIAGLVL